ncbi:MAG TPA: sugar transferase [Xanthobacteraceae bacterium]|jgi:exopolysaccharide production protein ExoY|nr:sugar transferase [Xanthobacteraceae bacterium]
MDVSAYFRRQTTLHRYWRSDRDSFVYRSATPRSSPLGGVTKRIIDLAVASFALFPFLLLFGLVLVTIVFFEGRPVFYRHPRIGYGRRSFLCLKFRTMVANGDEILRRHLQSSPSAAQEWAETRKLKNDPRVTPVGGVLRKLSLDELPQLINVLRGDMSIVGPRPIVADEVAMYGADAHYYFMARPGLTGPWQVGGRNDKRYEDRVALDRAYVENWSLWKDIRIILKTMPSVLNSKGSY